MCDDWPLERFCCPGDINSMPELNVLRNAFETGAAKFRVLSDVELASWRQWQREKARAAAPAPDAPAVPAPAVPAPAPPLDAENVPPTPGALAVVSPTHTDPSAALGALAHAPAVALPPGNVIPAPAAPVQQAVFNLNGGVLTQTRTRKKRSDAGKKRGPTRRTLEAQAAAAAAAAAAV